MGSCMSAHMRSSSSWETYERDSGAKTVSALAIVHLNFSQLVRISPKAASTRVFPLSRLAILASVSDSSTVHSSKLRSTRRRLDQLLVRHAR